MTVDHEARETARIALGKVEALDKRVTAMETLLKSLGDAMWPDPDNVSGE